jgi:hypothetical protein
MIVARPVPINIKAQDALLVRCPAVAPLPAARAEGQPPRILVVGLRLGRLACRLH